MRGRLSENAQRVIDWFGISEVPEPKHRLSMRCSLRPGQIILITGASGAGKSTLLRAMRQRNRAHWIELTQIQLPRKRIVDCFDSHDLKEILEHLARVGLSEAWTYLKYPSELSDGQRWRLRLALAISRLSSSPSAILAADEFCALLDRVTAIIVARTLRRTINANPTACAIVATSHDDLEHALVPDVIVQCDFGKLEFFQRNTRGDYENVTASHSHAARRRQQGPPHQFLPDRARSHGRPSGRSAIPRAESPRRRAHQRARD